MNSSPETQGTEAGPGQTPVDFLETSTTSRSGRGAATVGNLQVNFAIFQVRVAGRAVPTGKQEFDLLSEIVLRHDTIVSSAELSELLWGEAGPKYSRRLITLVHRLRAKLGAMDPYELTSVRGVGYGLVSADWSQTDGGGV